MKLKVIGIINNQLITNETLDLPDILTIGRYGCDLTYPQFRLLSRCHTTIVKIAASTLPQYNIIDGCFINDRTKLSTNGIFINGIKTTAKALEIGDTITLIDREINNRSEKLILNYGVDFETDLYATNC